MELDRLQRIPVLIADERRSCPCALIGASRLAMIR
jgi:hypothetical protein